MPKACRHDIRSNRSKLCTLVASGILSLPALEMHAASDSASSMAWVPPFPEDGRNVWAASPSWTTNPPGEVEVGCGSRHMSFQSTSWFGGVAFITRLATSGQPSIVEVNLSFVSVCHQTCLQMNVSHLRASSGSALLPQDSAAPPSSGWLIAQFMYTSFLQKKICMPGATHLEANEKVSVSYAVLTGKDIIEQSHQGMRPCLSLMGNTDISMTEKPTSW